MKRVIFNLPMIVVTAWLLMHAHCSLAAELPPAEVYLGIERTREATGQGFGIVQDNYGSTAATWETMGGSTVVTRRDGHQAIIDNRTGFYETTDGRRGFVK